MLTESDAQTALRSLFPNARITSGQRTPQHNALVGGVQNSMHIPGEAVDFTGVPLSQVKAALAANGLPATELLDEKDHIHWGWGPKPQRANAQVSQPGISDADLMAALTGGGKPNAAKASANARPQLSDDQLLSALTGKSGAAKTAAQKPTAKSEDTFFGSASHLGMSPENIGKLGSGFVQGFRDVGNVLAGPASYAMQAYGAPGTQPSVKKAMQDYLARGTQGYEAEDNGLPGEIGRVGGQTVATAPLIELGGAGLGLAGNALLNSAKAVPVLSKAVPAMEAFGKFVSGTAEGGRAVKTLSKAAKGAQIGAAGNALAGYDPSTGALIGGAIPVLGAGSRAAGEIVGASMQPFTQAGRGKIADSVIRDFASKDGGLTNIDLSQLIPGSKPTLAEAMENPGVSTLQRAVRDVRPTAFDRIHAENSDARVAALEHVAGDRNTIEAAANARDASALPLLKQAFAAKKPTDPQPVITKIDEILASPSGQRDVVANELGAIRNKLAPPNGKPPQTDPEQLYGIRKHITDVLSPLAQGDKASAKLASRELMDVMDSLDGAIEKGAPGYKAYKTAYSDMSKPINQMEFLQSLNLTNAKGEVTLAKVDSALKSIGKGQAKGGVNGPKSLSADQVKFLNDLRADLRRSGNITLGKSIGSNTFQNLATNNAASKGGAPLAAVLAAVNHPVLGAVAGAHRLLSGRFNDAVLNDLVDRLANPSQAQHIFAPAAAKPGIMGKPIVNRLLKQYGIPFKNTALPLAGNALLQSAQQP